MTYSFKVHWYNDFSEKEEVIKGFIVAETYGDAVNKIAEYFGEEDIWGIALEPFAPEGMIVFDGPNLNFFDKVKERLEERIIW